MRNRSAYILKIPADSHKTSFEVSLVEPRKRGWCTIVADNGIAYDYHTVDHDDIPKPFSFIYISYVYATNGGRRRRICKNWEYEVAELDLDETEEVIE